MTATNEATPLLSVQGLRKHFPLAGMFPWSPPSGYVLAVDWVSFDILPHETISLVGESGCGKTTTAKLIMRMEEVTAGRIVFGGEEVQALEGRALRRY
jgi:ABC-type oligopeptide transport system ATPase subunit